MTFATCFKETPLIAAILNWITTTWYLLMTSYPNLFIRFFTQSNFFRRHFFRNIAKGCNHWLKMPRTSRRKRSLSSGDESSVTYYSKHRCVDREYSPAPENRHVKHHSSRSRSRERRRRHRHSSRNRSDSTRRSDRKLRGQKHRNEPTAVSTVRGDISSLFRSFYSIGISL